eukprot:TRINITY_DN6202_c0_g1_i2.p3 TRINITY_DN6202_c0_g1~~TRINITY_DN6202_c0_g1_i2.p3  ORF type:complete len:131 (-),score=8.12 TRINITY_DN6202_c0_g1_i2:115-507(-)
MDCGRQIYPLYEENHLQRVSQYNGFFHKIQCQWEKSVITAEQSVLTGKNFLAYEEKNHKYNGFTKNLLQIGQQRNSHPLPIYKGFFPIFNKFFQLTTDFRKIPYKRSVGTLKFTALKSNTPYKEVPYNYV